MLQIHEARGQGSRPFLLVDVREERELELARIPAKDDDIVHFPMSEIRDADGELDDVVPEPLTDKKKPLVVFCHHGVRSAAVGQLLQSQGWEEVYNMRGGIEQWSQEVDTSIPKY